MIVIIIYFLEGKGQFLSVKGEKKKYSGFYIPSIQNRILGTHSFVRLFFLIFVPSKNFFLDFSNIFHLKYIFVSLSNYFLVSIARYFQSSMSQLRRARYLIIILGILLNIRSCYVCDLYTCI